jgi:hypothetical protein
LLLSFAITSVSKQCWISKQETQFETQCLITLFLLQPFDLYFYWIFAIPYTTFGTHYGLATLIPTAIGFFCAYYFDNKSILSIAITGLAAYIGLSINPQSILSTNFYNEDSLKFSAMGLGVALVLWSIYSTKIELKKHFIWFFLIIYT